MTPVTILWYSTLCTTGVYTHRYFLLYQSLSRQSSIRDVRSSSIARAANFFKRTNRPLDRDVVEIGLVDVHTVTVLNSTRRFPLRPKASPKAVWGGKISDKSPVQLEGWQTAIRYRMLHASCLRHALCSQALPEA